jgi:hypothetical protein
MQNKSLNLKYINTIKSILLYTNYYISLSLNKTYCSLSYKHFLKLKFYSNQLFFINFMTITMKVKKAIPFEINLIQYNIWG